MRDTIINVFSLSLIALLALGAIASPLVFSGFPPRSYDGPGLGYATFYVSPQDSNFTSPANGTWFQIQVRMENFTHVYSWQYQLIWKTDLLWLDPSNVTEVAGTDYIFAGKARTSLSAIADAYNATHTRLLAFESLQGAVAAVNGTDKGLTNVWFRIIKAADPGETLSTMLFFQTAMDGLSDDTYTIDEGGSNENDCTMKDGYYENAYAGRLIDVFVGTGTGPYPAPNGGQGQDKVAGAFEPQNPVCAYALVTYNGDPVQSKLVTFIVMSPSGLHDFSRTAITNATGYAYIEFNIPWPTADPYAEIYGTWNMTVKVDIRDVVVEDTVWFKVTIQGDVNGDGTVEGKDIAVVAKAFDSDPSNPRWNPQADLNGDGMIEGKDIAIVSKHFGETGT